MKLKFTFKLLASIGLLLSFACEDSLDECFKTVCDGPDMTNCREEPVFDSGCFPPPDPGAVQPEQD